MNQERTPKHAQDRTGPVRRGLRLRAFTLIEMLTVIAIIGVLAALLLPAISLVRRKAKVSLAKANIATLATALTVYNNAFGGFPPDTVPWDDSVGPSGVAESWPLPEDLSPNECLVWFLTRTFSTDDAPGTAARGFPAPNDTAWDPSMSGTVYSRISHKGSLDVRAKQLRDDDDDGYYEFVDGWGRPYFYQAYRRDWEAVTSVDDSAAGAGSACGVRFELDGVNGMISTSDGNRIGTVVGEVQLSGFDPDTYNGSFAFKGYSDNEIEIEFAQDPGNVVTVGDFRFHLHNKETFDLYSLGPNGLTRGAGEPDSHPWNAQVWPDLWANAWGTPGDGNDVATDEYGNVMREESDQDDINNWSK